MVDLNSFLLQNKYSEDCISYWNKFTRNVQNTVSQMILWDIQTGASYQSVLNVLGNALLALPIIAGTSYLGATTIVHKDALSGLLTTVGNVATAETAVVGAVGLAAFVGIKLSKHNKVTDRIDTAFRLSNSSYTIEDIRRYNVDNKMFKNIQKSANKISNNISRISGMIKSITEPQKPKWFNPLLKQFIKEKQLTKEQYSDYLTFQGLGIDENPHYLNFARVLDTIKEDIKDSLYYVSKFGNESAVLDDATLDSLYKMRSAAQQAMPVFKSFTGIGAANDDYEDVLNKVIERVDHIQTQQDALLSAKQISATVVHQPKPSQLGI
jgi:hypothetical protein